MITLLEHFSSVNVFFQYILLITYLFRTNDRRFESKLWQPNVYDKAMYYFTGNAPNMVPYYCHKIFLGLTCSVGPNVNDEALTQGYWFHNSRDLPIAVSSFKHRVVQLRRGHNFVDWDWMRKLWKSPIEWIWMQTRRKLSKRWTLKDRCEKKVSR